MPDHMHGIVLIEKPYFDHGLILSRQGMCRLSQSDSQDSKESKQTHPRFRNQGKNTISAMVGSFKSAVTKHCNENKLQFGWQSRFYDHIIRNNDEFFRIKKYIENNPGNWKDDNFYLG